MTLTVTLTLSVTLIGTLTVTLTVTLTLTVLLTSQVYLEKFYGESVHKLVQLTVQQASALARMMRG